MAKTTEENMTLWTRSPDKNLKNVRKTAVLAVFLGAALALGVFERMIPLEIAVPGVRLGLPNIVILALLYLFLPSDVIFVVILKCVLTAMLGGNFISLALSLTGSLLSFAVMSALIKMAGSRISPVGVSVAGAVFHNIGQIIAASYILGNFAVLALLPVLLVSGVITGVLTGTAVKHLLSRMQAIGLA